jgi:hypothetical protein
MRIPQQVSERVKEAPAQALRAVFSGIGQVLLVADRIKSRTAEPDRARPASAAPAAEAPDPTVRDETRWRSLDETGNVRLLSGGDAATAEPATTPPVTVPAGDTGPVAETAEISETAEAAPTMVASGQTAAEPAITPEASLPVPNYDNLSVPSLRARLRNLDPAQVRMLLDYEKANAGRTELITMFERRIAKLESDGA